MEDPSARHADSHGRRVQVRKLRHRLPGKDRLLYLDLHRKPDPALFAANHGTGGLPLGLRSRHRHLQASLRTDVKLPAQFGSASRDSRWLVLLCLLVGVLAPTACVLWFMNDALTSQKELTKRRTEEAYQAELASQRKLFAERFSAYWKDRVGALDRQAADLPAARAFEAAVRAGTADSVVVLTRDGAPAYPAPLGPPTADSVEPRADWADAQR